MDSQRKQAETVKNNKGIQKRVSKKWTEVDENLLLDLREQGKTYPEISKIMNRTTSSLKHKYVRLNQSANDDKHHHPKEKTQQVESLLNGDSLKILETNAGKGNLTQVYKRYGSVLAQDISRESVEYLKSLELDNVEIKQVDSFRKIHKYIYEGRKFDVIDLDPYGLPSRYFPHVFDLIDDGILFVTFPKVGIQQINKITVKHYDVFWGINVSEASEQERIIHEKMADYGFRGLKKVELMDVVDLGRVFRFAYKVKRTSALVLCDLKVKGVNC